MTRCRGIIRNVLAVRAYEIAFSVIEYRGSTCRWKQHAENLINVWLQVLGVKKLGITEAFLGFDHSFICMCLFLTNYGRCTTVIASQTD